MRSDTVRVLLKKGLLEETAATASLIGPEPPPPFAGPAEPLPLKEEQQRVFTAICSSLEGRRAEKMLLHGVTAVSYTHLDVYKRQPRV